MAFKKSYTLAIDLGSSAVRVGVFAAQKGQLALLQHGELPVSLTDDSESNRENNEMILALALEKLLTQLSINPKKVVKSTISIPGKEVGIKQIRTVKLTDEELESSLLFEARKHLPVKGDEVLLDYQVLKEDDEGLDILLAVAARQAVEGMHRVLEHCGLKPDVIDAPILAINNAILAAKEQPESTLVIHCGHRATTVSLYAEGQFMTRDIPTAGKEFTEELRKEKQISSDEAEALKRKSGVMHNATPAAPTEGGELGLSLALAGSGTNPAVEALTRELQRSVRFFMKEAGLRELATVALTGGSCADRSFTDHLATELRIEPTVVDPFALNGMTTDIKEGDRSSFVQLVGLGIGRANAL